MASAWGTSFGKAFGVSWGMYQPAVNPPESGEFDDSSSQCSIGPWQLTKVKKRKKKRRIEEKLLLLPITCFPYN
jgi:hypothetical protein